MEVENISATHTIWSGALTFCIAIMGYFIKKRDDKLDEHDNDIAMIARANTALELKIAENYATKPTVIALFQEATQSNEKAIARVERSIDIANSTIAKLADTTNTAIIKQGDKIDKVVDSISAFQSNVMSELSKKT